MLFRSATVDEKPRCSIFSGLDQLAVLVMMVILVVMVGKSKGCERATAILTGWTAVPSSSAAILLSCYPPLLLIDFSKATASSTSQPHEDQKIGNHY